MIDLLNIPSPGDPGFAEHAFNVTRQIAARMTERGWKFSKAEKGPGGFYHEGRNSRTGRTIIGSQEPTPEAAFLTVLRQANGIEFPISR